MFFKKQSGHAWISESLRDLLDVGPDDYLVEAGRMVERDLGPEAANLLNDGRYPEDWEEEEQRRRGELLWEYHELLARTASYTWGLGIAGLFHQWERDIKDAILELTLPGDCTEQLERADFVKLCSLVEATGFQIRQCPAFDGLDTSRLITNAIKHGDGAAFRNLALKRPNLIHGPVGVRIGNLAPRHQDLRLSKLEFEAAAKDIQDIWQAYAATYDYQIKRKR